MKNKILIKISCILLISAICIMTCSCKKPETTEVIDDNGINTGIVLGNIVKDMQSDYVIVVPEDASECNNYAAEEFQSIIAQSTDIYIPIRGENQINYTKDSHVISIGNTKILQGYNFDFDFDSLNGDGFYIKTADKSLFIIGAIDRGTLYGVYDYLEKALDVGFYASDCTYVPKYQEIKLNQINIKEVPTFKYRAALHRAIFRSDADRVLYARYRQSHEFVPVDEKYGGQISWYQGVNVSHNTMSYVPISKYYSTPEQKEANKDMYVYNENGQPYDICWTNGLTDEGLIDETKEVSCIKAAIESLKQFVLEDPDAEFYSFGQEDFKTCCTCESCRGVTQKYGQAGTIIRFVNNLAREIQKWADSTPELNGKTVNIVFFSYLYSTDAPVKLNEETNKYEAIDSTVIPEENVYVRLAPFYFNRYYSLADEDQTQKQYTHYLEQWSSISDQLMAWSYAKDYGRYFLYYSTIHRMQNELSEYADAGIFYMLEQLGTTEQNDFQSILDGYVYSKMLWNPYQNPYELRKDFIEHYYGIASENVQTIVEFYDEYYYNNQIKTNGSFFYAHMTNAIDHPVEYLEYIYNQCQIGINAINASDLTQNEKNIYIKRMKTVKLVPLYMLMTNRQTYYSDNQVKYNAVAKEFFEICDELNVEDYGEHLSINRLRTAYPYSN